MEQSQCKVKNFQTITFSSLFNTMLTCKKYDEEEHLTNASCIEKDQYSHNKQKQSSIYIYVNKLNFINCHTLFIQLLKLDFPVDVPILLVLDVT